jgi:hypothetical protein
MAVGEQANEHPLQHLVLTGDDTLDLEERALKRRLGSVRLRARG